MADLQQMLTVLIPAAVTLTGAFLVWRSNKADRATQTLDMALRELRSQVKDQEERITRLTTRLDESERARRDQDRTIRNLEDRERDRQELIQDFLERHVAVDAWFQAGEYTPPLPDPSWRITQAVEQYINEQKEVAG